MYKKILNQKTENILSELTKNKIVKDFYLAGGTALALQLGHRKSIDLYFILKNYSLVELMRLFSKKYQKIKYNQLHILKSLIYFVNADNEPMPMMLQEIHWQEIKEYFRKTVKQEFNI